MKLAIACIALLYYLVLYAFCRTAKDADHDYQRAQLEYTVNQR